MKLTEKQIEALVSMGGRVWEKHNLRRVYFDDAALAVADPSIADECRQYGYHYVGQCYVNIETGACWCNDRKRRAAVAWILEQVTCTPVERKPLTPAAIERLLTLGAEWLGDEFGLGESETLVISPAVIARVCGLPARPYENDCLADVKTGGIDVCNNRAYAEACRQLVAKACA